MGIDWITYAAQLVNLAILVYLLYRFLYKPMLKAIDAREAKISGELKKSEEMAKAAEKRLNDLNRKNEEIESERQKILHEAHKVANELKARLEREIRADAAETRMRWEEELKQERKSLEAEMREMIVSNFMQFARKALIELAEINLETQIVEVLKHRFAELPKEEKERLMPKEGETPAVYVYTAKELNSDMQEEIGSLINGTLKLTQASVLFEVNPHLLSGVEISVDGNVLTWNLDAYLRDFTDNMNQALENISLRLNREENKSEE